MLTVKKTYTKHILFIIVIFITLNSFGQSKWKFGGVFSIDDNISSDFLADKSGNVNGYVTKYNKSNYTFGLLAEYELKIKFSLETGMTYTNKDFSGVYNCASCIWLGYGKEIIEQRFIQVPILLKYYIIDEKIKLSIKTGLQNNFSVKNTLENKKYYLGGVLGSEIRYQIIDNWNFEVGYQYNKSLTDLYNDKDFDLKSNNFFLNIIYGID